MYSFEDYFLEQFQKYLCIEEESRERDKIDNFFEGTSEANAIEKIEPFNKSNNRKPSKNFNKFKKKSKDGCFVCGSLDIMQKGCRHWKRNNFKGKVNFVKEDNIVASVSEINAIK